jgi:hypothetical protein
MARKKKESLVHLKHPSIAMRDGCPRTNHEGDNEIERWTRNEDKATCPWCLISAANYRAKNAEKELARHEKAKRECLEDIETIEAQLVEAAVKAKELRELSDELEENC